MHTLLIHQVFCLPHEPGGTRHYELASRCVTQGHRFTVVASDVDYGSGRRRQDDDGDARLPSGLRVLRAYTPQTLHRGMIWRVWAFVVYMLTAFWRGLRAGKVDLVMGTTPPIFQTVSAWLIARLKRCPFVLEVRDLWPEFAIDIGVLTHPLLISVARAFELWLYRRADHIVVNSPYYRQYVIEKGIPADKVTLIANGVDPTGFDPDATGASFRSRWSEPGQFVVAYAGALGLANDIPTILRAAARLKEHPQVVFWLVGDGAERKQLEAEAGFMGLRNVRFTGSQPKASMKEVLAASDACLATLRDIPMFRTTYPNKVFDYLAAGRPIILGIDGVIREVVEAAGAGVFVPPGNDERLAEAVLALQADTGKSRAMGRAGREHVVRHFNREDQAREFASLLARVSSNG